MLRPLLDRLLGRPAAPDAPPFTDADWAATLRRLPWLRTLSRDELGRLRALCTSFLAAKTITGVAGAEPGSRARLSIAAQACLPVLELGLGGYRDFVEVIVYPGAFRVRREVTDELGLVHEVDDVLAGEAMPGGPVVLSWEDVRDGGDDMNVVIHEFVHKLDLADGVADGCPPMPAARARAWQATLSAAFEAFVAQVEAVERRIPDHVDPESAEAAEWWDSLPLDPYAATDESEFFAVAAESFFIDPLRLRDAFPALHAEFTAFFRQDPAARLAR